MDVERKIPVPNASISFAARESHLVETGYSATMCVPTTKTRELATRPATRAHALGEIIAQETAIKRPAASPLAVKSVSFRSCTCLVIVQTEPLVKPRSPVEAAPTMASQMIAGCL